MNSVLPRIQPEVNTAPQKLRLKPGLAITGNDLAFAQRALAAPNLFDDANLRVRDVNNSEQPREAEQKHHNCKTSSPQQPRGLRK